MSRIGDTRYTPPKLIDTWVYEVKDVELETKEYDPEEEANEANHGERKTKIVKERIVSRKVTVEIRMEKTVQLSTAPPHPLEKVRLIGTVKEMDIKVEGTDLEAIRALIWSKLDARFEIKWEQYYLVKVEKERIYSGMGTGMSVSYDSVYKGTTWDGKPLLRIWRYRDEKIEPWPGQFTDDGKKVIACIEATEANRLALEEFCARLDLLRKKLVELLAPENITQTLLSLNQLRLLPEPEQKDVTHAKTSKTRSGDRKVRTGTGGDSEGV